jgi:hypothetical protein
MRAKIESVEFTKEYTNDYGTFYNFKVTYNGKTGFYTSKKREQTKFIKGQECEFEEKPQKKDGNEWIKLVPETKQFFQGKSKPVQYASFAVSYVKDLIIADKLEYKDLEESATEIFNLMKKLDGQ